MIESVVFSSGKILSKELSQLAAKDPKLTEIASNLLDIPLVASRLIKLVLLPVKTAIWATDSSVFEILQDIAARCRFTPPDFIIPPDERVAAAIGQSLTHHGGNMIVRKLLTNCLGMAMDKRGALFVHPSFPAMIKEMHPDEARLLELFSNPDTSFPVITLRRDVASAGNGMDIIKNFSDLGRLAGCDPEREFLTPSYLDNLQRFNLVVVPDGLGFNSADYVSLENAPLIKKQKRLLKNGGHKYRIDRKMVFLTELGKQFVLCCVLKQPVDKNTYRAWTHFVGKRPVKNVSKA